MLFLLFWIQREAEKGGGSPNIRLKKRRFNRRPLCGLRLKRFSLNERF